MDYEKAYKEALERAKGLIDFCSDSELKTLENVFPELRDSEDERIRKELLEHFKWNAQQILNDFDNKEVLAWLEKQGEHAKFRESIQIGDEVTRNKDGMLVNLSQLKRIAKPAENKGKNNMGISEATKKKLEDNLNKALEKETPESCNKFLEKQGEQKVILEDAILDSNEDGLIAETIRAKQSEQMPQGKSALEAAKEEKVDNQNCVKSADKVGPKFKVGDWVVNEFGHLRHITKIKNDCYYAEDEYVEWHGTFEYGDTHFRLWTIQDAKPGDVLEFGDHGRLVVGIVSYVNKTTGKVDVNCLLENNNFKVGNYYNLDTIKPHPATKEQRDLLFQKMKEAGYEWDAEHKQLKKIEQKFSWSDDDEIHQLHAISLIEDIKDWGNKDGMHSLCIERCIESIDWLKSLKDRVQLQSKQEWSAEDKKILDDIIDSGKHACFLTVKQTEWLETLKDRVQPQTKYEWSDDDEKFVHGLIRGLAAKRDIHGHTTFSSDCIDITKTINWLKSLRLK